MSASESTEIVDLLANLIDNVDVRMNQEVEDEINGHGKDVASSELTTIVLIPKEQEVIKPKLDSVPQEESISNQGGRLTYESVLKSPYSLTWHIPNFTQQEGPLVSPPFIDRNGRRFNLQIFPKGDSHTVDDHISICICPDKDSNATQDSVEKRPKVRFILWAMKPNGYRHTLIESESLLTEKEYYRETITLQEIRSKRLLWDERLKLAFQFCAKLRVEPLKMNKKAIRYARSPESPSEIPNDSPEEAMPKEEFISTGPNPTDNLPPYSFTWIIPNFTQQDGPIVSPSFIDQKGRRFTMHIFPKGDSQTADDHISICFCPDLYSIVSQATEDKVRFILWAISPTRNKHFLLESESLLTEKKYFRETITLQTLQRKRLLDDNRLELRFQFCAKLKKKPQPNNEPKNGTKLARSLSPSEIPNEPPKKKQKQENAISNVVTQTQAPNETPNEPNPHIAMSIFDLKANQQFISSRPNPTSNLLLHCFTWTIPNFTQHEGPHVSPTFIDRESRRFNFQVFPKGDSQTRDDFLSICICPDKDFNASQDSGDETRQKVHYLLFAMKPDGKKHLLLEKESLLTETVYFRKAINLQTLKLQKLLVKDTFFTKIKPQLNNEPKNETKLARSLSPSEVPNEPPKKKQKKQEIAISNVVTQTQGHSETNNGPKPDVVMSFFDVNAKEEFISTGANPTNAEPAYSCTWTIPNFTKKKGQLVSPTFLDQTNRRFNLEILPKGDSTNRADFFSICISPDKELNASQDAEENLKDVRFILAAVNSTGERHPLLDYQGTFTEKYLRKSINTHTIRRKGFLDGNRLKLHFQFSRKLMKKTKKEKKLARIQMAKESRKMKKESERKTHAVTRSQTRNATQIEPKPDAVMPVLDVDVPNEKNLIATSTASEIVSKPEIEIINID